MRISIIAAATVALGMGLAAAPPALASCQNICVHAYNACIADGTDPAVCQDELDQCLADCRGGGVAIKDPKRPADKRMAQQCRRGDAAQAGPSTTAAG